MRYALALFAILALSPAAFAQEVAETGSAVPGWYAEHLDYMTRDGGRWVAENSEYQSDQETTDRYIIVFSPEFGGTSMSARLFGVTGGEESVDFWHFTGYWDAARGEAVLIQTGWGGGVGSGPTWQIDASTIRSEQVFSSPGGPVRTEAHIFTITGPDEHVTRTLHRTGSGEWTEGRTYRWVRETPTD